MMAIKYDLDRGRRRRAGKEQWQARRRKWRRAGSVALKEAQQKFSNKIRHTKRSSRWQHRSLRQEEQRKARAENERDGEEGVGSGGRQAMCAKVVPNELKKLMPCLVINCGCATRCRVAAPAASTACCLSTSPPLPFPCLVS